jgi:hypothetical protein
LVLHTLKDGRLVISQIARGRWSAYERERNIRQYAEDDSSRSASSTAPRVS